MKNILASLSKLQEYSAIPIRVLISIHLIIGTQDNLLSWDRMLEFRDFWDTLVFLCPCLVPWFR